MRSFVPTDDENTRRKVDIDDSDPINLSSVLSRRPTRARLIHLAQPAHDGEIAPAMKIHEYQAKAILAEHGVPVPQGEVVLTPEDAAAVARRLGPPVVVKAQIHAGGRGKGGGV